LNEFEISFRLNNVLNSGKLSYSFGNHGTSLS
jgi:hypothetical protein